MAVHRLAVNRLATWLAACNRLTALNLSRLATADICLTASDLGLIAILYYSDFVVTPAVTAIRTVRAALTLITTTLLAAVLTRLTV